MPEHDAHALRLQPLVLDRAARAGQIRIEDDDRAVAADVVVVADGGHRGAAQVLHVDSLAAMEDLQAAGIRIRRFRDADAGAFAAATHDPEIVAHSGLPASHTPASARDLFRRFDAAAEFVQLAIADAEADALLGTVILFNVARHEARCEVGFWLVPGARGRGVATVAVGLICG